MTTAGFLPVFVFALLAVAAFGVGEVILRRTVGDAAHTSILAPPILAAALGFAAIGNSLFIAGVLGPAYRRPILWPLLIAGAAFGSWRFVRAAPSMRRPSLSEMSIWEMVVIVLTAVYSVRWFGALDGFTTGDDVFSHHYAHAKLMAKIGRYGHEVTLPWGLDIVSNYNASFSHVLYVIGHLLADERASNLLHWLTQLMLIGSVYLLARTLGSREAGVMAVGIYLGASLLGNEPLSVQDYSMTAVLTLLTVYAILMLRRSGRPAWLVLAAILGGFVASSKNYGIPILIPIACLVLLWTEGPIARRIRATVLFAAVAFVVYSPWFLYNLITMGDPWFPFFRGAEMADILRVTERVDMLKPFIIAGHPGRAVPVTLYFTSLFLPFEPRYVMFGLSIIPLIALPLLLHNAVFRRTPRLRESNALFVVSIAMFLVLFAAIGRVAFYKWALFPATIYFATTAVVISGWRGVSRHIAWVFVVTCALLNYVYIGSPMLKAYAPRPAQRDRWDELTAYLNQNLEPHAGVAGAGAMTSYYLRADLESVRASDGLSMDWSREEAILRRMRVSYFITDPNASQQVAEWYTSLIDASRTLDPKDDHTVEFLSSLRERNQRRFADRDGFLARYGSLLHEFGDGKRLYRLALANRSARFQTRAATASPAVDFSSVLCSNSCVQLLNGSSLHLDRPSPWLATTVLLGFDRGPAHLQSPWCH
jgi:dolichyl-phosphate-mannose-protein mannosyltransferase